jgi:UDP-2-acetamido-3-amino-2,3-dideoxy-glucuronate N-acetyltransferase
VSPQPAPRIAITAQVDDGARLEDRVVVGPAVVFTNDRYPRAINPDGSCNSGDDWHAVGVTVGTGAAIGVRSVCIAPVEIGEWALVATGATVTRAVLEYVRVTGSPAHLVGWVGRAGARLVADGDDFRCLIAGELYRKLDGALSPVESGA